MSRPTPDSPTIRLLYEDEIIVILRRVVGQQPWRISQTWIETPEGYVWSPAVQPAWNQPNLPILTLPETSLGRGMWAEVTIPYVELVLDNPPARALDPNPSPMRFNQVSGNRQADAAVLLGAGAGFVHLVETIQVVRSAVRELLLA